MTEEDELVFQSLQATGQQKQYSLTSYFRHISNVTNEVKYDDNIIDNLVKIGENSEASKAFARLLKEHKYLKMCLEKLL